MLDTNKDGDFDLYDIINAGNMQVNDIKKIRDQLNEYLDKVDETSH